MAKAVEFTLVCLLWVFSLCLFQGGLIYHGEENQKAVHSSLGGQESGRVENKVSDKNKR